jgi:phospholipase/lecithinase/hemolysin
MLRAGIISMNSMQRWIVVSVLAVVLGTPNGATAQVPFDRIVVFGSSVSETGNAFALIGEAITPPDYSLDPFLVPGAPYARGGHHFSNGATWIEQFARPLGLAWSIQPAFRGSAVRATNYAVGAARARDDGANFNLSLLVGAFLLDVGGAARADA